MTAHPNLYESAPYVARELLARLARGVPEPNRILVYRLRYEIRNGFAPELERATLPDSTELSLMEACRRIVGNTLELFSEDLVATNSALRKEVVDLLVSLDDKPEQVRAILLGARRTTHAPEASADID